jgi:hypothetical protein
MKKPKNLIIQPPIDLSNARHVISPETIANESRLFSQDQTIDVICSFTAGGGALTDLCDSWGVRYGEVNNWINSDKERRTRYFDALEARKEWAVEKILKELRTLAMSDIRKLFDESGAMLPVDKWPEDIARAVEAVKVDEITDHKTGQVLGYTRQVKLWSKTKALEMLARNLQMFLDRLELSKAKSLEDIIVAAKKEETPTPSDESSS